MAGGERKGEAVRRVRRRERRSRCSASERRPPPPQNTHTSPPQTRHRRTSVTALSGRQGCTIDEADLCGDPPLVLAAGNGGAKGGGSGGGREIGASSVWVSFPPCSASAAPRRRQPIHPPAPKTQKRPPRRRQVSPLRGRQHRAAQRDARDGADVRNDTPRLALCLLRADAVRVAGPSSLLLNTTHPSTHSLQPHTDINSRAAHNGHLAVVDHLVAAGADLGSLDLGDNTALHWAAMRGHVEVVRALVVAGADRSRANAQGMTPADLCDPQWSLSWRFTREALSAAAR